MSEPGVIGKGILLYTTEAGDVHGNIVRNKMQPSELPSGIGSGPPSPLPLTSDSTAFRTMCFIANNNVQPYNDKKEGSGKKRRLKRRCGRTLRGLLIGKASRYWDAKGSNSGGNPEIQETEGSGFIGAIYKARQDTAVVVELYPSRGALRTVDLMDDYLYCLQQVGGTSLDKHTFGDTVEAHVCENGNIRARTKGPDHSCLPVLTAEQLQSVKLLCKDAFDERYARRNEADEYESKCLRKCDNLSDDSGESSCLIYVLDDPDTRKSRVEADESIEDKFALPLGKSVPVANIECLERQTFVYCSKDALMSIFLAQDKGQMTEDEDILKIVASVDGVCPNTLNLLVPSRSADVCVRLLDDDQWNRIPDTVAHTVETEGGVVLKVAEEKRVPSELRSLGVIVSKWTKHSAVQTPRIDFDLAVQLTRIFGRGYGSRKSSLSLAMNVYLGARYSSRPRETPFEDKTDIPYHCFFNSSFKFSVARSAVEKEVQSLKHIVMCLASRMHAPLMSATGDICGRGIVTGAMVGRGVRLPVFGFCCSSHVDVVDKIIPDAKTSKKNSDTWAPYDHLLQRFQTTRYLKEFFAKLGIICPTTCCYRLLWKNNTPIEGVTPCAFFNMEGLGLCMPLRDGTVHHFVGPAFAHSTAVPVLRSTKTGTIEIAKKESQFLVFAWGSSGGRATASGIL